MLQWRNTVYEMFEYIPGQGYPQTLESTFDSGRILALYHKLLENFQSEWQPPSGSYHRASAVESGLRSIAASEGFTIEASNLGKFKMVVQIVAVVAVILDHRWKEWPIYNYYFLPIHWIALAAIWFMVCVSLASAIDYFVAFWSKIDRRVVKRRRRRAFILSRRKPVSAPPQADRDVAAST